MAKVNILPPEIVSKIAAGEVIERPASVVKELIENALDAYTSSIELHLQQSGKSSIVLKDTGVGIEESDIANIFLRHATSKIANIHDLYSINSLGFRGEALYSIAAISDVVLRSKTDEQDSGLETHVRGSEVLATKPATMITGTEIEVKELFYNTPARRKFLKTDSTELTQILNVFIPYTLLHPEIRFKLNHHMKTLIDTKIQTHIIDRIADILHLNTEHIIEAYKKSDDGNTEIRVFLGDINIQRVKKDMQFVFVNGRPVSNYILGFHINQVYRLLFPHDIYPFFALYVTVPIEDVDVNVHPTKREVKIHNDRDLIHMLRKLCEHSLMSSSKPKQVTDAWTDAPEDIKPAQPAESGLDITQTSQLAQDKTSSMPAAEKTETPASSSDSHRQYTLFTGLKAVTSHLESGAVMHKDGNLREKLEKGRFIGSFLKKYLFFESGTSLLLVDQHAAQERVMFEKYTDQINSGQIEVQKLLTPLIMPLSHQEMFVWEEAGEKLEEIGISTTQWDKGSIAIHAHPEIIDQPELAVRNILAGEQVARCRRDMLARWACRSSVMAGDSIKKKGAEFLQKQLLETRDPFTCPHGRPTIVEIEERFLNRQFLRK